MNVLGLTITRRKQDMVTHMPAGFAPMGWVGSLWRTIHESFAGAWQRNITVSVPDAMSFAAVWACVTLIASDIAKLWINLVEEDEHGICTPVDNPAYSPVLRKPNHYQTRLKFIECWIISKLTRGNTYVLKERDQRGVVVALYVLDPTKVQVLVAPNGEVFYQLGTDNLAGIEASSVTVPASEIIHDVMVPLYHPLYGVSPIYACGLAAMQGLRIQQQSENFFANHSQPGGLLLSPQPIGPKQAEEFQTAWQANFSGPQNQGKLAVLGGGMTYTPLTPISAHDAQLIEQLKWTAETVCAVFHVPAYKVGAAPVPAHGKPQDLTIEYYQQALQGLIENLEQLLTEGLELKRPYSVECDLDALLRMDTATAITSSKEAVTGALFTPNEARRKFNMKPLPGGDSAYLQQQNFSLEALAKRDASDDPFRTSRSGQPAEPAEGAKALVLVTKHEDDDDDDLTSAALSAIDEEWRAAA